MKAARFKDQKIKEKGEGAALKNPQASADDKDDSGVVQGEDVGTPAAPNPEGTTEATPPNADDVEKKTKAADERRERAERKRRKAEENGSLPREFVRDSDSSPQTSVPPTPRPQDRPTTDPVRIYRRCCQLRESPILKRITEQLSKPSACPIDTPGVVTCLNLTGSRLQLPDVVALSDWLAVVPVKKLLLEDADLTDEGVRVILAGLLAAKHPDRQRSRERFQTNGNHNVGVHKESLGMVEKLTLKNNPRLTSEAWKHVSLFTYMCRSLKALDMSTNKFPNSTSSGDGKSSVAEIFGKALSTRLAGSHLEELMMAECSLTTPSVKRIVDAAEMCGIKRLGVASNNLDDEGLDVVVRYVKSGVCEGLDIGGNDLRDRIPKLISGFTDTSKIWAISLADCKLSVNSLKPLFPTLVQMPNFRFLDLSHNHDLFGEQPDALPIIRRYLPQLPLIKRLHLCDCGLEPRQAIALAEIIPETEALAHLNILENPALARLAGATTEEDQEEACALYASLMAAARVSESIVAIDIEVPTPESSDLVKALAKQVVAYCLRNMERWTASEASDGQDAIAAATEPHGGAASMKDIEVPEVLMHLVGHMEGSHENHDNDDPAPDEDYIVGGTGVVKILNYCLGEKANEMRRESVIASGPNSGVSSPARRIDKGDAEAREGKAKKLSLDMLGSARKIRMRLRPAMIKEAESGDDMAFREYFFTSERCAHANPKPQGACSSSTRHCRTSSTVSKPSTPRHAWEARQTPSVARPHPRPRRHLPNRHSPRPLGPSSSQPRRTSNRRRSGTTSPTTRTTSRTSAGRGRARRSAWQDG
ncbi:MAG: hypothetical protein INR71_03180 [Terriglobus roseus]|nr:hypothetical protein [Terriglobus roseus]